jgi:hypothetical protein
MHHFGGGIGDASVLKVDQAKYLFALGVLDIAIVCVIMF